MIQLHLSDTYKDTQMFALVFVIAAGVVNCLLYVCLCDASGWSAWELLAPRLIAACCRNTSLGFINNHEGPPPTPPVPQHPPHSTLLKTTQNTPRNDVSTAQGKVLYVVYLSGLTASSFFVPLQPSGCYLYYQIWHSTILRSAYTRARTHEPLETGTEVEVVPYIPYIEAFKIH